MMEQPKTAQAADGAFVHAVGELYRLAIRTRPWDTGGVSIPAAINALQLGGVYASLSEDDKFQVRVVVIGLVTVDCALELVYANETSRAPGELEGQANTPPVGLLCASQLLNALVRRSSDPAWRYVSAIRSLSLSPEAVPIESDNSWRRNFFAGFVQALRWAAEQDGGSITVPRRSSRFQKRADLPISPILSIRPEGGYAAAKRLRRACGPTVFMLRPSA